MELSLLLLKFIVDVILFCVQIFLFFFRLFLLYRHMSVLKRKCQEQCHLPGDYYYRVLCNVQFSSVAQSCPTLCNPTDCSTPGLPDHHQLPEFTQTNVIESVMPSNHVILCNPLLLPPSIFPKVRIFSNGSIYTNQSVQSTILTN